MADAVLTDGRQVVPYGVRAASDVGRAADHHSIGTCKLAYAIHFPVAVFDGDVFVAWCNHGTYWCHT